MQGFDLLKEKTGQELVCVLRDDETLLLRFSDGTWLIIEDRCYVNHELYIEKKGGQ